MKSPRLRSAATVALALCVLPGCAATPDNSTHRARGVSADCSADELTTVREDKLTIATDNPALEPWYSNNDPTNGEGFESAVGYRVAGALGFHPHNVVWRRVPFRDIIAGGQKPFDLALDEVTILPGRTKAVDFSNSYFDVTQGVLTHKDGKFANVSRLSDLKSAHLGALGGTTSYQAIGTTIRPDVAPQSFDSMAEAIAALNSGKIDGIVTDLPTAFELARQRVEGGKVVGQVEPEKTRERFGVVLPKGSKITGCVNQALASLRKDGTLARITDEWTVQRGAPKLK